MKLKLVPIAALLAAALASPAALAQKKYDPGASDTEIKIGNINALQRPGLGLRHHRQGRSAAYFKKINDEGGINGRKINFISPRRRLQPAQDGRDGAQAGRAGRGAAHLPVARHAVEYGDPQVHEREEGAAAVRRHRRDQVERPEEFPLDHGLAAELPDRGADLRRAHPEDQARTPRSPCFTRTTTTARTTCKGFKDGLGDKAQDDDRHGGLLRGDRPDRRFADRAAAGLGRRHVLQHHDAEVRRAGDPQGLRHRLEAGALPEQRVGLGRLGADAGRPGQVGRPDHHAVPQGSGRSAVGERPGDAGLGRVHEEVLPGRQPERRVQRLRLHRRADAGAGAQAVRRQPDARERHEAGGEPEELHAPPRCCRASRSTPAPTDFAPIESVQLARFDGKTWVRFGDVMGK